MNKVIWPIQDKPVWKGEKGKRVVLWKEQGIGDQIILFEFGSEVREMCSTLSVYVDPRLQALCKRAMPEINFIQRQRGTEKRVEYDYHLPLGKCARIDTQ